MYGVENKNNEEELFKGRFDIELQWSSECPAKDMANESS